jgi:hypothetical protein
MQPCRFGQKVYAKEIAPDWLDWVQGRKSKNKGVISTRKHHYYSHHIDTQRRLKGTLTLYCPNLTLKIPVNDDTTNADLSYIMPRAADDPPSSSIQVLSPSNAF